MPQSNPLSIGMDVPKDAIAVASVSPAHLAEVLYLGAMGTRQGDSDQLSRKMPSKSTQLVFVSEAGPCGYGLSRSRTKKGHVCQEDSRAVTEHRERLGRLAQERHDQGQTWYLRPVVDALQALRGVQCTVAGTIVAALGKRTRFDQPSPLMRSLGLTPFHGRSSPPRRDHHNWQRPSAPCLHRRRLGLSVPCHSQPASPTTAGKAAPSHAR
jgi:hypothetical protein